MTDRWIRQLAMSSGSAGLLVFLVWRVISVELRNTLHEIRNLCSSVLMPQHISIRPSAGGGQKVVFSTTDQESRSGSYTSVMVGSSIMYSLN
jgi:hypothetical protein